MRMGGKSKVGSAGAALVQGEQGAMELDRALQGEVEKLRRGGRLFGRGLPGIALILGWRRAVAGVLLDHGGLVVARLVDVFDDERFDGGSMIERSVGLTLGGRGELQRHVGSQGGEG